MLPPLVADIDIAVSVIQFLRARGVDVVAGREENWNRYEDRDILREAHAMNRFVLTHDSDFGTLAVHEGQTITGIIHLRPGNRPSAAVIADLQVLLNTEIDWTPPLIVVCESGKPPRLRRLVLCHISFAYQQGGRVTRPLRSIMSLNPYRQA